MKIKIAITQFSLFIAALMCGYVVFDVYSGRWFEGYFHKYYHTVIYGIISAGSLLVCCASATGKRNSIIFGALLFASFFVFEIMLLLYVWFNNEGGIDISLNIVPFLLSFLLLSYFLWASILWWNNVRNHTELYFINTPFSKIVKPIGVKLFDTKFGKYFLGVTSSVFVIILILGHLYFYKMEYKSELQQRFMYWEFLVDHDIYIFIASHPDERYTRYLISEIIKNEDIVKTEKVLNCTYGHLEDAISNVTGKNFGYNSDKWKKWYEDKYNKKFVPFKYYNK